VSDFSKRVETSVNTYRLRLAVLPEGVVVLAWDYPGSTLLRVRIMRASLDEVAAAPRVPSLPLPSAPDLAPDVHWQVVYDAESGSCRDRGVEPGRTYRYAIFARDGDGPWVLWRDETVTVPRAAMPSTAMPPT
jgi:hypothetical protein